MSKMITVDTGYANAGVLVEDDVVVFAPPVFKWMYGKRWSQVRNWNKIEWTHEHEPKEVPDSRGGPEATAE